MSDEVLEAARLRFKELVCDRSADVDPHEEFCWMSLSIGFFVALGLEPEAASDLALRVRYKDHYFKDEPSL